MRSRLGAIGVAAVVASVVFGAAPPPAHAAAPAIGTEAIATGLSIPWDVAFAPDGTMLVTERAGRIRVFSSGNADATLVHTVNVPAVQAAGEAGVMGIAVDVDFASNGFVFVCASRSTAQGWRNEVLRYHVAADGSWSAPTVILGGMIANNIHNGCAVEMDRHGMLWVSMGDANVATRAQDRNSLNGKILRIRRDGSIPADNPIISGTRNAVYSVGHRNPQGIAFRPGSDQVYAVEHGPEPNHGDDEVNLLVPGGNYGWPCYTGFGRPYQSGGCQPAANYRTPAWSSGAGVTLATSGAAFMDGSQWGDWHGHLFVSQLKESDLRRFAPSADGTTLTHQQTLFNGAWGRLRAAVSGPGGQLYITTSNGSGDQVIRISPHVPTVSRISGRNRDETAAAISRAQFPGGVAEVMVATGSNFPDALAGSAAAAIRGMPVLLVRQDVVPAATGVEIDRLNPQRIFALGGPGAISDGVLNALAPYTTTGEVIRVWGNDRYGTAVAISQRWYGPGVPAAFIATGTAFPDALAGAPAAALNDAPLLLVKPGEIPPETATELDRLDPGRIYVLGGPGVVTDGVVAQLQAYTAGPVTRIWGPDRYGTAAAVSRTFWGRTPAYVATGTNFPDALGGGAAAGRNGAPLLLANPKGVPLATGQELLRIGSTGLTLFGGFGALSANAEAKLKALVGSP